MPLEFCCCIQTHSHTHTRASDTQCVSSPQLGTLPTCKIHKNVSARYNQQHQEPKGNPLGRRTLEHFVDCATFHFSSGSHLAASVNFKPRPPLCKRCCLSSFYQRKLHALNPLPAVAYVERVCHSRTSLKRCLLPAACGATHIKSRPCPTPHA